MNPPRGSRRSSSSRWLTPSSSSRRKDYRCSCPSRTSISPSSFATALMFWRKGSYNGTAAWPISLKTSRCNAVCYPCNARRACAQDARCDMRMLLAIAVAVALGATSARAQDHASGPMTVMVGFAPGGPTDTLARIITERMRLSLGQPLIVENVPGATGTIAIGRVVRAAPDGRTLSMGNWTTHVGAPAIYPIAYDVLNDL